MKRAGLIGLVCALLLCCQLTLGSLGCSCENSDEVVDLSADIDAAGSEAGPGRLLAALVDGKYGFIDTDGAIVIEPQYVDASDFSDGLAGVLPDEGGLWGYIDQSGTMVIEPQFAQAFDFSEGLARAVPQGESIVGYIDMSGVFLIEPQFDAALDFSEGLAAVQLNGEWGYIDQTGAFAVEPQYHRSLDFSLGWWPPPVGFDEWYVSTGNPQFHVEDPLSNPVAAVTCPVLGAHYIDKNGTIVIEPQFDQTFDFSEGLARAVPQGESIVGYIDMSGVFLIEPQFEAALDFSEGLAAVLLNGEWGYIDQTGALAVEPQFTDAQSFSQGLAGVKVNGEWGYIDQTGAFAVEPQFDHVYPCLAGVARAVQIGVDESGRPIWIYFNEKGELMELTHQTGGLTGPTDSSVSQAAASTIGIEGSWELTPSGDLVTLDFQMVLRDLSAGDNPITGVKLYIDDLKTPAYDSGTISLTEFPPPPGMIFRRDVAPGVHSVTVKVTTADGETHEKAWQIECGVSHDSDDQECTGRPDCTCDVCKERRGEGE